jgi:hypothetical protein
LKLQKLLKRAGIRSRAFNLKTVNYHYTMMVFFQQHNCYRFFRCYADFARVGGKQQVSLSDECVDYPTVIHEFMHVVGFIHEHQRDDRDGYVKIVWNNIIPGMDFDKLTKLRHFLPIEEVLNSW